MPDGHFDMPIKLRGYSLLESCTWFVILHVSIISCCMRVPSFQLNQNFPREARPAVVRGFHGAQHHACDLADDLRGCVCQSTTVPTSSHLFRYTYLCMYFPSTCLHIHVSIYTCSLCMFRYRFFNLLVGVGSLVGRISQGRTKLKTGDKKVTSKRPGLGC